ncbi:MAG: Tol-Pal system beta propeller repeat protein TolB [candidate division Zixibacteria bacterium]|nr:Tol-Pal system beta propeller repeat protein TolB [candidate division Zixibacteria bacterium]
MKIIKFYSLILVLFFLSGNLFAQEDDREVFEYLFDTLTTGSVAPRMIGVDEMKYIGTQYIGKSDSTLMRYITAVVQYDIDFYADFELVLADSFYLKTYEIKELDILGWKRLGAEFTVKLEAELPGQELRVWWSLIDTGNKQQFAREKIEMKKSEWRQLGHKISNEIVKTLTGEDGIFLTKIVYVKKNNKNKEIFISDFDGANEVQLTNNHSINISPTFAPNGKHIYFTSYMDGDPQLYIVDINSKVSEKIGSYNGIVAAPSISPDGDKIACVLSKDGNSEIYLLDLSGKVIKRLTRHRSIDTSPTWSPDGKKIAFVSDRSGSPQIYIMDSFGLNNRRLTFQGRYNDSPIWAKNGDRITFVSRTKYGRFDLASINTDGTDFRVLTMVGMNENPHFSPDGKHIIFSSTRLGPKDIFTMDITGRNQRRLTRYGFCSNPIWGPNK